MAKVYFCIEPFTNESYLFDYFNQNIHNKFMRCFFLYKKSSKKLQTGQMKKENINIILNKQKWI